MLQVSEDADGEDVPRCALVAHEDKIFRLFQCSRIGILHLALFIQFGKFARKRDKHLNVEKRSIGKGLAQIGQSRSIGKQIFLPRDLLLKFVVEFCRLLGLLAFGGPRRLVILRVVADRIEHHQVPVIALAVSHPKRSFISSLFQLGCVCLIELDQIQQSPRRCLYQRDLIEVRILGGACGLTKKRAQEQQKHSLFAHSGSLTFAGLERCRQVVVTRVTAFAPSPLRW